MGLIIFVAIIALRSNKFINDQTKFENNRRLHVLNLLLDEACNDSIELSGMLKEKEKYHGHLFLASAIYRVEVDDLDELLRISLHGAHKATIEELFWTETKSNYQRYRIHSDQRSPGMLTFIKNR